MISIIVAIDKNNAIGQKNKLLWHLAEDLAFFKKTTMGCSVLMGRKTFESIGKPLPGRKNIIVSRRRFTPPPFATQKKDGSPTGTSVEVINDLIEFLENIKQNGEDIFVIGGASIYNASIKYADTLFVTHIDATANEADSFFPKIENNIWEKVEDSLPIFDQENQIYFNFSKYIRKKSR